MKSCHNPSFASHLFFILLMAGPLVHAVDTPSLPENLVPKAEIQAVALNTLHLPQFVADGYVPQKNSKYDNGSTWAVYGKTNRNNAQINFIWPDAVTVGEIIYYGRTAWDIKECFKDYQVLLDDRVDPVTTGKLKAVHGPQRIRLPKPRRVRKLSIKFTSSYGGRNPGASEIQIFSESPTQEQLKQLFRYLSDPYPAVDEKFQKEPDSIQLKKDFHDGKLGFTELVVIQRQELTPSHVYTYHVEGFRAGGGLYIVSPDLKENQLKQLVDSHQGQILDFDLSYDARQILFSWRKSANDTYHLYTINIDGTELKRITEGNWHDFNACWLPDGDIVFLSTRKPAYAYCWISPVGILHRMSPDGSHVKRISANYLNDFTPSILSNGKVIYGRWEYVDRPAIPIQSLWTVNPDGTNLAVYYGNRVLSPATFIEPQAIGQTSTVLCTLTAHNGPCRGAIGIIDPSYGNNSQKSIRNLTPEIDIGKVDEGSGNHVHGPYESPYPLDSQHFLCSRSGTILLRDYDGTKQMVLLRPQDNMGFYHARPLRTRPKPPRHPSALPDNNNAGEWAAVYLQDVYNGLEPYVNRGEVTHIAVVQEIEKKHVADLKVRAFGFQFPLVSCGATYSPKKVWGYAQVDKDGSAYFKVPANLPIYFMALDKDGQALQRMRSFTHLMPGEIQGCIGCHEPRNQTSRNRKRLNAFHDEPQELETPEWGLGGFSYARIVQPVLDRHCVQCHQSPDAPQGIDLSGDMTDFFNVSYEILARQGGPGANPYTKWISTMNGYEANILQIEPKTWGSPASKLAQIIHSGHPDKDGKPRIQMHDFDKRRIYAWIDLNVPYYGTSLSNYIERIGCRQMVPDDFEKVFQEVGQRRCVSCHQQKDNKGNYRLQRKEWLRISHPELNNFMLAPLAKTAGGAQACKKAVFQSKDDPDYQAILKTFEPLHKMLKQKPRMDMPGGEQVAKMCRKSLSQKEKAKR